MQSLLRSSHVPLYIQLADLLAQEIQSGRIPSGHLVPSEAELYVILW